MSFEDKKTQEMRSRHVCVGLLAHVDAGKTTLSESLLYMSHAIKKEGRVDHKDSFLDHNALEHKRGITIYAKEARFSYKDIEYILEDTPGHIDFSLEMERVLPILDHAILLVDTTSEIRSYTKKLFSLLKKYEIPTIIFLNKIDLTYKEEGELIKMLKEELCEDIIDFTKDRKKIIEDVATYDERLFKTYLDTEDIEDEDIIDLYLSKKFYPLILGSALKHTNIQKLLDTMAFLMRPKIYPSDFKAYVYRISQDKKKERLTSLKILGGTLKVKERIKSDKADELRLYSGTDYKRVDHVVAGDLITVKGVDDLLIGEYINDDKKDKPKEMVPYLEYTIKATDTDDIVLYDILQDLQKEDPLLDLKRHKDHLTISLMGMIQMEVIKEEIKERYGITVEFSDSTVSYKETILKTSYGIGHYEPLRHYAEVHLRIRPLKRGQGKIVIDPFKLQDSYLDIIKDHLLEKDITGVRIGAPVIDIEIAIIAIKTSLAHTSSEDIRKATDFAIRNALLDNDCIILEPFEDFHIKAQAEDMPRLIFEIEKAKGSYTVEADILKGRMSALELDKLMKSELIQRKDIYVEHSFTINDEVLDEAKVLTLHDYDPYEDPYNPSGSIFFKNGAGYHVTLEDTYDLAHIKPLSDKSSETSFSYNRLKIDDAEVKRVFERANPQKKEDHKPKVKKKDEEYKSKEVKKPRLFIVDGYNALFALKEDPDLESDKDRLLDELSYYQGMKGIKMWVVFDAYNVDNASDRGDDFKVIYTKKDETADEYIQRTVRELKDKYSITVVTSDRLIQVAIFSFGAYRMSSRRIFDEIAKMRNKKAEKTEEFKNTPFKELLKDYKSED